VTPHVADLLALEAAGALTAAEAARVDAHLRECADCAAEAEAWRGLADDLRRPEAVRPSRELVARTRVAVEQHLAERGERRWNQAALGFLVAFAWTLAVVAWAVFDLVAGEVALWVGRPLGSVAGWYALYLVAGWVTAGAAAVLLGRKAREEGRIA
jgi:anti-sigma factor RsiW